MKVNLVILVPHASGNSSTDIAVRLAKMGGHLTGWRPQANGEPARAYFTFDSEEERKRIVAEALAIPGVTLETPMQSDYITQQNAPRSATA